MGEKLVCAALVEDTLSGMVSEANASSADLVELRLDYVNDLSNLSSIKEINKPVIATCMPEWEGGRFKDGERERLRILGNALDFIDYVTLELKTGGKLRDSLVEKAKKAEVKVIIASHDFEKTPCMGEVNDILESQEDAGADIAKVAFTPENECDVLRVLNVVLQNTLSIPLIALSMGELGRSTRIIGPMLGSYLTYAASSRQKKSAAGQLSVDEIQMIFNKVSG